MEKTNILLYLGTVFSAAFLIKNITRRFRIPEVTGYVLLGILLGVSAFNILSEPILEHFDTLTSIALAIIAFIIGSELKLDVLKKLGKSIFFIAFGESLIAFFIVTGALTIAFTLPPLSNLNFGFSQALIFGAVASATAPAATVAVIQQYKAKGPLTSTIMAVVGIDDAIALIIYVFASSIGKAYFSGDHIEFLSIMKTAGYTVTISLILGTIFGFLFMLLLKKTRSNDFIEILIAAAMCLQLGLCEHLHLSELLTIMTFGAVISNNSVLLTKKTHHIIGNFSGLFLIIFFVMGGAHLNILEIKNIWFLGLLYFLSRTAGKISGAKIGAKLGGASPIIQRYIGFAILPQVGVALALALAVKKDFEPYGDPGARMAMIVINILLFTTIFTEIIGPLLTKHVLEKAGELDQKSN